MAERLRAPIAPFAGACILITTNRLSHRCVWCEFELHTGHMCDKPSSACGCARRFFFKGFSHYRSTY